MLRFVVALATCLTAAAMAAQPREPSPHAIEIPKWFTESFLDFRDEVRDATREGKRVMIYFGQDGCPYCKALMKAGFGDPRIEAFTRRHFVAVALNLWGDRETTWSDGRARPEKELARTLNVQYTPTLLFLDEKGAVALRLDGYQPPEKVRTALEYVAAREEKRTPFADWIASRSPPSTATPSSLDLRRLLAARDKPLLVVLRSPKCAECDELEREGFARPEVREQLSRFHVATVDVVGEGRVILPDGRTVTSREWARELGVVFTPTLLLLERDGREAFRADGYLRPFHLASTLDYVASGAYRREPSFQRFIQGRADALREKGRSVELW